MDGTGAVGEICNSRSLCDQSAYRAVGPAFYAAHDAVQGRTQRFRHIAFPWIQHSNTNAENSRIAFVYVKDVDMCMYCIM